jgi:hypothetical protein
MLPPDVQTFVLTQAGMMPPQPQAPPPAGPPQPPDAGGQPPVPRPGTPPNVPVPPPKSELPFGGAEAAAMGKVPKP